MKIGIGTRFRAVVASVLLSLLALVPFSMAPVAMAGPVSTPERLVTPEGLAAPAAPLPADAAPPGANDWSCTPSAEHPEPVILAHGLSANMATNWRYLSPILAAEGYCVFALTYGTAPAPFPLNQIGGLLPIEESAEQLAAFVDEVLAATGASTVDMVGHSEGTLLTGYYAKFLGGPEKVSTLVELTPLWDGSNVAALGFLEGSARGFGLDPALALAVDPLCAACRQVLAGSEFIEKMNSGGGPAVPGVQYTNILTRYDELVIPYTSGLMDAPNATNIVLQDGCPSDFSGHAYVAFDPVTASHVLNALDPANATAPACVFVPPTP